MYSKLFQKILDSSIWLESDHVRLVWITMLAAMDQDGVVALSAVGNVAARARVSEENTAAALQVLESPDTKNPGQDHEGRRIERIPQVGWLVINAKKYRDIIKAETARAQTRERVARHRAKLRNATGNADVTLLSDTACARASVSDAVNGPVGTEGGVGETGDATSTVPVSGWSADRVAVHLAQRWTVVNPRIFPASKASHHFASGLLAGIPPHELETAIESMKGRKPFEIVDALKPKLEKKPVKSTRQAEKDRQMDELRAEADRLYGDHSHA